MNDSPQEGDEPRPTGLIGAMGNPFQQSPRDYGGIIQEAQHLPNRYPDKSENKRVNCQESNYYWTPNRPRRNEPTSNTPGYNVPTYNRFSPLRRKNQYNPCNQYTSYRQNRRYAWDDGDFSRDRQRDGPPGKWIARVLYRNPGWRGQNGNRVDAQRGGLHGMMEDFPQEQGG